VAEYVARTPGAIGYVASGWLIPAVNVSTIEGSTPSAEAVEEGRYLLVQPFYIVARSEPTAGLADFVTWLDQGQAREIIQRDYALAP
jgi:ABC-type phosphate transport system substrate-binding protein